VAHRRGLIALIAGAIALVGVAVAVVFFVVRDTGGDDNRLVKVEDIDTTRPDEKRPIGGSAIGGGSGGEGSGGSPEATPNPLTPRPPRRPGIAQPGTPGTTGTGTPETPTEAGRLEAREIEEMAGKNSGITQRCFMRAQRGAEGILIGDVKKIAVTLTISGDGSVTDAQLSDNHAQNSLGKCLITAIRSWRFRASPGGTFRFVLHFG